MSFYNSNVKSWVISPVFHRSNLRSEFRLPSNATFASNLRLLNVGVISAGNEGLRYNYLAGSGACIKNIYLMDGKTMIDQVLNFQTLEAFKRYNKTNSLNCDVNKVLHSHGMGFVYADDLEVSFNNVLAQVKEFYPDGPNVPTNDVTTTPRACINLREVFPVLSALLFLDTTLFSRLSVIIEYTSVNAMEFNVNIKATDTTEPLLIADEILDPSKLPKFKGVEWNTMELETVQVGEGLNNTIQVTNRKLMGFNEKTLNRLLVQKALSSPVTSPYYGTLGSEAMVGETFQVVVNGSNLLADSGITTPSMALAMLTDTFGNCNTAPMANDLGTYNGTTLIQGAYSRIGHLSYFGVLVKEKIKNLQISYSRTCRADGDDTYKAPMVLNFFGEVTKAIVLTKDGYKVLYV